jgi:hypothetical protein
VQQKKGKRDREGRREGEKERRREGEKERRREGEKERRSDAKKGAIGSYMKPLPTEQPLRNLGIAAVMVAINDEPHVYGTEAAQGSVMREREKERKREREKERKREREKERKREREKECVRACLS